LVFQGRTARFSPTACYDRKFSLKENENLLTPFAISRQKVAIFCEVAMNAAGLPSRSPVQRTGRRLESEPLLGKRTARSRFKITFKFRSPAAVSESDSRFYPPRTKFRRVRHATVIMLLQAFL